MYVTPENAEENHTAHHRRQIRPVAVTKPDKLTIYNS